MLYCLLQAWSAEDDDVRISGTALPISCKRMQICRTVLMLNMCQRMDATITALIPTWENCHFLQSAMLKDHGRQMFLNHVHFWVRQHLQESVSLGSTLVYPQQGPPWHCACP